MINLLIPLYCNVNNKERDHQNTSLWNKGLLSYPIGSKLIAAQSLFHEVVFGGLSVYFLFIKNRKHLVIKNMWIFLFTKLKNVILGNCFTQGVSDMLVQTSEAISHAQTRKKFFFYRCVSGNSFGGSPATWWLIDSSDGHIEHLLWLCLDEQL